MDAEKRARYEQMMTEVRSEIGAIDQEIEQILADARARIAGLQNEKEAQEVIYDGYCRLLGVENDLASDEEDEEDDED